MGEEEGWRGRGGVGAECTDMDERCGLSQQVGGWGVVWMEQRGRERAAVDVR